QKFTVRREGQAAGSERVAVRLAMQGLLHLRSRHIPEPDLSGALRRLRIINVSGSDEPVPIWGDYQRFGVVRGAFRLFERNAQALRLRILRPGQREGPEDRRAYPAAHGEDSLASQGPADPPLRDPRRAVTATRRDDGCPSPCQGISPGTRIIPTCCGVPQPTTPWQFLFPSALAPGYHGAVLLASPR